MNFIRRLNKEKITFQIRVLCLISGMEVMKKVQNFSSISLKLYILEQKTQELRIPLQFCVWLLQKQKLNDSQYISKRLQRR